MAEPHSDLHVTSQTDFNKATPSTLKNQQQHTNLSSQDLLPPQGPHQFFLYVYKTRHHYPNSLLFNDSEVSCWSGFLKAAILEGRVALPIPIPIEDEIYTAHSEASSATSSENQTACTLILPPTEAEAVTVDAAIARIKQKAQETQNPQKQKQVDDLIAQQLNYIGALPYIAKYGADTWVQLYNLMSPDLQDSVILDCAGLTPHDPLPQSLPQPYDQLSSAAANFLHLLSIAIPHINIERFKYITDEEILVLIEQSPIFKKQDAVGLLRADKDGSIWSLYDQIAKDLSSNKELCKKIKRASTIRLRLWGALFYSCSIYEPVRDNDLRQDPFTSPNYMLLRETISKFGIKSFLKWFDQQSKITKSEKLKELMFGALIYAEELTKEDLEKIHPITECITTLTFVGKNNIDDWLHICESVSPKCRTRLFEALASEFMFLDEYSITHSDLAKAIQFWYDQRRASNLDLRTCANGFFDLFKQTSIMGPFNSDIRFQYLVSDLIINLILRTKRAQNLAIIPYRLNIPIIPKRNYAKFHWLSSTSLLSLRDARIILTMVNNIPLDLSDEEAAAHLVVSRDPLVIDPKVFDNKPKEPMEQVIEQLFEDGVTGHKCIQIFQTYAYFNGVQQFAVRAPVAFWELMLRLCAKNRNDLLLLFMEIVASSAFNDTLTSLTAKAAINILNTPQPLDVSKGDFNKLCSFFLDYLDRPEGEVDNKEEGSINETTILPKYVAFICKYINIVHEFLDFVASSQFKLEESLAGWCQFLFTKADAKKYHLNFHIEERERIRGCKCPDNQAFYYNICSLIDRRSLVAIEDRQQQDTSALQQQAEVEGGRIKFTFTCEIFSFIYKKMHYYDDSTEFPRIFAACWGDPAKAANLVVSAPSGGHKGQLRVIKKIVEQDRAKYPQAKTVWVPGTFIPSRVKIAGGELSYIAKHGVNAWLDLFDVMNQDEQYLACLELSRRPIESPKMPIAPQASPKTIDSRTDVLALSEHVNDPEKIQWLRKAPNSIERSDHIQAPSYLIPSVAVETFCDFYKINKDDFKAVSNEVLLMLIEQDPFLQGQNAAWLLRLNDSKLWLTYDEMAKVISSNQELCKINERASTLRIRLWGSLFYRHSIYNDPLPLDLTSQKFELSSPMALRETVASCGINSFLMWFDNNLSKEAKEQYLQELMFGVPIYFKELTPYDREQVNEIIRYGGSLAFIRKNNIDDWLHICESVSPKCRTRLFESLASEFEFLEVYSITQSDLAKFIQFWYDQREALNQDLKACATGFFELFRNGSLIMDRATDVCSARNTVVSFMLRTKRILRIMEEQNLTAVPDYPRVFIHPISDYKTFYLITRNSLLNTSPVTPANTITKAQLWQEMIEQLTKDQVKEDEYIEILSEDETVTRMVDSAIEEDNANFWEGVLDLSKTWQSKPLGVFLKTMSSIAFVENKSLLKALEFKAAIAVCSNDKPGFSEDLQLLCQLIIEAEHSLHLQKIWNLFTCFSKYINIIQEILDKTAEADYDIKLSLSVNLIFYLKEYLRSGFHLNCSIKDSVKNRKCRYPDNQVFYDMICKLDNSAAYITKAISIFSSSSKAATSLNMLARTARRWENLLTFLQIPQNKPLFYELGWKHLIKGILSKFDNQSFIIILSGRFLRDYLASNDHYFCLFVLASLISDSKYYRKEGIDTANLLISNAFKVNKDAGFLMITQARSDLNPNADDLVVQALRRLKTPLRVQILRSYLTHYLEQNLQAPPEEVTIDIATRRWRAFLISKTHSVHKLNFTPSQALEARLLLLDTMLQVYSDYPSAQEVRDILVQQLQVQDNNVGTLLDKFYHQVESYLMAHRWTRKNHVILNTIREMLLDFSSKQELKKKQEDEKIDEHEQPVYLAPPHQS